MTEWVENSKVQIDSVLIIRHGYLIYESNFNPDYGVNTIHILHSVSKSFTSAIIGVAIDKGLISLDDKVVDFFPERTIQNLDSRKQAMTIEHLLTMTAGFQWDEWSWSYDDPRNDLHQMRSASDPYQFLLDKPMAAQPGEQWVYNTGCTDLLTEILRKATGSNILDYGREYLFEPLNISNVTWLKDDRGNYMGGSGLGLTPRDMAKFGYLFLHNGTWNGERVLSSNWVAESTSPLIQDNGFGTGYGYMWWCLPDIGAYYASGRQEQSIYVVQDLDLVVVMTGSVPDNYSFPVNSHLFLRYILPACGDYAPRILTYSNNNITLNYPAGMSLRYTENLGNTSFHQIVGIYSPKILSLNWGSRQGADAELNLNETLMIFEGILNSIHLSAGDVVTVESVGDVATIKNDGHNATIQPFAIKVSGISYEGINCYWFCTETHRHFLLTYIRPEGSLGPEGVREGLQGYLDAIVCH